LSKDELVELAAAGLIADRPPPGASFRKNAKKPAVSVAEAVTPDRRTKEQASEER
jgi:hypothetical protein